MHLRDLYLWQLLIGYEPSLALFLFLQWSVHWTILVMILNPFHRSTLVNFFK